MHSFILALFLAFVYQVQATDWLNRTVRVDLIQSNRRAFDQKFDILQQTQSFTSAFNATNGQYPWSVLTTAWSSAAPGFRFGTTCAGTIISSDFVLSDFHCIGQLYELPVDSIEVFVGSVEWISPTTPTNFVRHFWYIEPTSENRPNIVLFRLHETLTFNPNVHPIRLPIYEDFAYEGWSSLILGFQTPEGPFTAQLQSAQAKIVENSLCNFQGNTDVHEICSSEGSDPYQIGPILRFNAFTGGAWIVYEYYDAGLEFIPVVIGIHQYQFANQTASFGHATRVSHFVEWIEALSVEDN